MLGFAKNLGKYYFSLHCIRKAKKFMSDPREELMFKNIESLQNVSCFCQFVEQIMIENFELKQSFFQYIFIKMK